MSAPGARSRPTQTPGGALRYQHSRTADLQHHWCGGGGRRRGVGSATLTGVGAVFTGGRQRSHRRRRRPPLAAGRGSCADWCSDSGALTAGAAVRRRQPSPPVVTTRATRRVPATVRTVAVRWTGGRTSCEPVTTTRHAPLPGWEGALTRQKRSNANRAGSEKSFI